ncbi:MAG: CDGSH iron-sulfur domain-containing protein, partial [Actinomycetia bacterium]|nr:CDGSH iron-sulfur domain-containing protein [Actinomycetes bacterium]
MDPHQRPKEVRPLSSVLETRNRVTLCRCGASTNKPL